MIYTQLMVVARKAKYEASDLKTAKPLTDKSAVSSKVGEEHTERWTSSGAIDGLYKQVANLKSLVTSNKNSENGIGSNQKKTYPTETVIMDPRLIVKPLVATDHGPFIENQMPMQCHHCHGWCQCPTKIRFKWEREGENPPVQHAMPDQGNISQLGRVAAAPPQPPAQSC